ncbi:MAG TPA: alpha/beta fold hydrolase [Gemmatimonadaceae bacterium]|nr:alpha/beta fold hydrolase [Gemmatimonadaceae bacterium]
MFFNNRRQSPTAMLLAAFFVVVVPGCYMAHPALTPIEPSPAALGASNVQFASRSGSTIHAWLARGRVGLGAVLILHGVGSNRTTMLARAEYLHDAGYTVLAPDFQAHGESQGEHITFGALESRDAAAAFDFLRKEAPGERIGIIGVSMGGAAALLSSQPLAPDALVLESVYPTISDALTDRLNVWFGPFAFLSAPVAPVLLKIIGADIGVDESQLRPIDHIADLKSPVLVVAGTDDRYTTIEEAETLYARARSPKSFWAVEGATHEDIYDYSPRDYQRVVGGFLSRYLRPRADTLAVTPER